MKGFFLTISIALVTNLFRLGGSPQVVEEDGAYTRMALTDSMTLEVFEADSVVVVMTACAPQCSSYARVYNKEWTQYRNVAPTVTSIFPLATMDKATGRIVWIDNDTWEY